MTISCQKNAKASSAKYQPMFPSIDTLLPSTYGITNTMFISMSQRLFMQTTLFLVMPPPPPPLWWHCLPNESEYLGCAWIDKEMQTHCFWMLTKPNKASVFYNLICEPSSYIMKTIRKMSTPTMTRWVITIKSISHKCHTIYSRASIHFEDAVLRV